MASESADDVAAAVPDEIVIDDDDDQDLMTEAGKGRMMPPLMKTNENENESEEGIPRPPCKRFRGDSDDKEDHLFQKRYLLVTDVLFKMVATYLQMLNWANA